MSISNRSVGSRLRAAFCAFLTLGALTLLSGCATHYVDTALKDVKTDEIKKPASLKPTQLLFEFQTKGAPNARATADLKKNVIEHVHGSGLFSAVTESPAESGSLLKITINNVPLTDNAFSKGFVTGLTFGAAGSTVTDGYICTVNYSGAQGDKAITKSVRHAIHTTLGAKGAPANAIQAKDIQDAVNTMVRQIVSNAMKELADDGAFR